MKKYRKIHVIHTYEQTIYFRKPNMGENTSRRPMLSSLSFRYQNAHAKEWTLTLELPLNIMAQMTTTKSFSSSVMLSKYCS